MAGAESPANTVTLDLDEARIAPELLRPELLSVSAAHKLVFVGSPAEGLVPQSHQEFMAGPKEGFLGNR